MAVSDWAGSSVDWCAKLEEMKSLIAPVFKRKEQRVSAGAFIDGLFSNISRKTGWMMAEEAGMEKPYRIQSLLGRSSWSADELCARIRKYSIDSIGDSDGVLIVDETGFLKKGTESVGVARQYSGTAGRIENCQIGVFAAYASRFGHALIDRRLYLPKPWADNAEKRLKTHVPVDTTFATKPELAMDMISDFLDQDIPCSFVLADAVYGANGRFRHALEAREQAYVLATRKDFQVKFLEDKPIQTSSSKLFSELPTEAWQPLSAGEGSKGTRLYHWARIKLNHMTSDGFSKWILARRSLSDAQDISYFVAFAKVETTLAELAAAAGLRWCIEECFLRAKDDLGLDHCEARSWHGWYRHITLVMAAAAFLTNLSAEQRRCIFCKENKTRSAK